MLTKRQFLLTAAAGAATLSRPGLGSSAAPSPASELISYDGVSLAALIRSGELSQKEVLEVTLRRIDTLDGQLNAVVTRTFEQARERAESNWLRGPLAGVPYLIKDGADYKGFRKTLGSRFLKDYISPESPDLFKAY